MSDWLDLARQIGDYATERWVEIVGSVAALVAALNSHRLLKYQRSDDSPLISILRLEPVERQPGHYLLTASVRNRMDQPIRLVGILARKPGDMLLASAWLFNDDYDTASGSYQPDLAADPAKHFTGSFSVDMPIFSRGSQPGQSGYGGDVAHLRLYVRARSSSPSSKLSIRLSFRTMDSAHRRITKDMTITVPAVTPITPV